MREISKEEAIIFIKNKISSGFRFNTDVISKFKKSVKNSYKLEIDDNKLFIYSKLDRLLFNKYECKLEGYFSRKNKDMKELHKAGYKRSKNIHIYNGYVNNKNTFKVEGYNDKSVLLDVVNDINKDNDKWGIFHIKSFENNEDLEILKKFNVDNSKKKNFKLLYRKPFLNKYQYKIKCIRKFTFRKDRELWVKNIMNDLFNITGDIIESDNHKFSKQSYNMSKITDEMLSSMPLPQRTFSFYLNEKAYVNMVLMTLDEDTTDYTIEITMEK